MEHGQVVFFKNGYGFIQPSDGTSDLYFHASDLPGVPYTKEIEIGTHVAFERAMRRGKPVARCVTPNERQNPDNVKA